MSQDKTLSTTDSQEHFGSIGCSVKDTRETFTLKTIGKIIIILETAKYMKEGSRWTKTMTAKNFPLEKSVPFPVIKRPLF